MPDEATFDEWAVLELFGHQRMAGRLREQNIAGTGFVRVDVPDETGTTRLTRFVHPNAVYAINPVTREIAVAVAANLNVAPVRRYEIPALQATTASETEEEVYDAVKEGDDAEETPFDGFPYD